jgi:hypothetical protein
MNIDVVPDITMRGQDDPHRRATGPLTPTVGRLGTSLRELAGRPASWWALAGFDPARPVRTRLDAFAPDIGAVDVWLTTWPPGHRSGDHDLGGYVRTLVAGELIEVTIGRAGVTERPLRAGRIRVRGAAAPDASRELHNPGPAYAITLHARPR